MEEMPSLNMPVQRLKVRSNPITGLTLLWARNPFRGDFNHWQVSRKEETSGYVRPERGQQLAQLHDKYMIMSQILCQFYGMCDVCTVSEVDLTL